jgi:hypothetical protein
MAKTYKAQLLNILRDNERQMGQLFGGLAAAIGRQVLRAAGPDGTVARDELYSLQRLAGDQVIALFLSRDRHGRQAALDELPDGSVFPLSPYARVLWDKVERATRVSVEREAAVMARYLTRAPEVASALRRATRNPFEIAQRVVAEQFHPNPLAAYDPAHLWVDPNGYRLSDRIWRAAGVTRRKLDLYLESAVIQGKGALEMARELEQFLHPGRHIRTRAPYGTDASYDAMRLARTEISRAAASAQEMSALMNPFVVGVEVILSASHVKPCICEEAASAGAFPKDAIPAQYRIPMHPHCMCTYRNVMTDDPNGILDELRREQIGGARDDLLAMVGPLMVERFTKMLLRGWRRI